MRQCVGPSQTVVIAPGPSLGRPRPVKGDQRRPPPTGAAAHTRRSPKSICDTGTAMPKPGDCSSLGILSEELRPVRGLVVVECPAKHGGAAGNAGRELIPADEAHMGRDADQSGD